MNNTRGKLLLAAIFVFPIIVFFVWRKAEVRYHPLEIFGDEEMDGTKSPWTLREFNLINQTGDTLHLEDFDDKIIVANFFYATCPSICPRMNNNLRLSVDKFKDNPQVVFLSHSVNPEEDSVSVLHEYAAKYAYPVNKWHFVTGRKAEIYDLAEQHYHIVSAAPDGEHDFIHSTMVVLVDKDKRVRGYYETDNNPKFVKELNDGIQNLLMEYNPTPNVKRFE